MKIITILLTLFTSLFTGKINETPIYAETNKSIIIRDVEPIIVMPDFLKNDEFFIDCSGINNFLVEEKESKLSDCNFLQEKDYNLLNSILNEILASPTPLKPDVYEGYFNEIDNLISLNLKRKDEYLKEQERKLSEFVNFDEVVSFIDVGHDPNVQYYIDKGYLTKYWGDVYHHNTGSFWTYFKRVKVGSKVQINNTVYTCTLIEHGFVSGDDIFGKTTGNLVYEDGVFEIITCDGGLGTTQRWIIHLA